MATALRQWTVGTDLVDLREARIRAEVRGEADPRLHAMMIEELEAAAEALNDRECPLEGSYFALGDGDNAGVARGIADLVKLANDQDAASDKVLEEAKAEAAKERDDLEARYDAMLDERNALMDRAQAAEAKLRELGEAANGLDDARVEKLRDQERSLKLFAGVVLKAQTVLPDDAEAAVILARSIMGVEVLGVRIEGLAPRPVRKRVAKVKP